MGGNASRKLFDDLGAAIQNGRVDQVQEFLQKYQAAQTSRSRDKETQAMQAIDLNALEMQPHGNTALMVAAGGCQDLMVHLFLEARCDPNILDHQKRSAMHYVARTSAPQASDIMQHLLACKADPCIADTDGNGFTPLDLARQAKCLPCVLVLEERLKLWEGWVDHWEPEMLVIPTWKPKWLVIAQDRRPNTGKVFNHPQLSCSTCGHVQKMPPFVSHFKCSNCGTGVAVAPSLQIAFYEPRAGASVGQARPDNPRPSHVERLPQMKNLIRVEEMKEAGGANALDSLFKGKLRQMVQSTVSSTRTFGVSIKLLDNRHQASVEHSVRLPTQADRDSLMLILKDPCSAAYQASLGRYSLPMAPASRHTAAGGGYPTVAQLPVATGTPLPVATASTVATAVPTTAATTTTPAPSPGSAPEEQAWFCSRCTYEHAGDLASLTSCTICDAPRGSSTPAPADDPMSSASAPTLEELDPAPAPAKTVPPPTPLPPKQKLAAAASPSPGQFVSPQQGTTGSEATLAASAANASDGAGMDVDEDKGRCVVCLERLADTAVIPCGHMCGCHACLQSIQASAKAECPMCRGPITSVVKIYQN